MQLLDVRLEALMVAKVNEIFLGYQPCQWLKINNSHFLPNIANSLRRCH
jgi:hypothetical protein